MSDQKEPKKTTDEPKKKVSANQIITDWLKVIGLIAATGSAIWAVFEPVAHYVKVQKQEKEITWTKEMVTELETLADSSYTTKQKNHAIFRLSAYEEESLPFLMLELESSKSDEECEIILTLLLQLCKILQT